uniref:probable RNA-binding protein 19 n=1 Tax=Ictidomys tridecemlineatus TaxID=43179 RepID=UPI001A9D58FA|nr:probable RNA-binding protein 19 [Ictidomys tridecemlineatus]
MVSWGTNKGQNLSLQKNVLEFLVPLKPVAIRKVRNAHGNKTGYVFVDFSSEEEVKRALKCNQEYMGKEAQRCIPGSLAPAWALA